MIAFIKGAVIANNGQIVVVQTPSGVGYEIMVTSKSANNLVVGKETALHTYLAVRENAMELFGFENLEEKDLFVKFLSVSGIGPRTALQLLSLGSVNDISNAIAREDVGYLTNVSGIGKKIAERIVIELKSKVQSLKSKVDEGVTADLSDVVEGLIALGYSAQEAREAVKNLNAAGKNSETLLKEALQKIR